MPATSPANRPRGPQRKRLTRKPDKLTLNAVTVPSLPERLPSVPALANPNALEKMGFTRTMITEMRRMVVTERGWTPGTDLENQVMILLTLFHQKPEQQYKVGRYRVDFAWPDVKVVLEADGWYHRSPEGAAKDRARDSWLRSQGWLVFRVDDEHGTEVLAEQIMRVSRFVRSEGAS